MLIAATSLCLGSTVYLVFLIGLVSMVRRVEASRPRPLPISSIVMAMGAVSIVVATVFTMMYGAVATSIAPDAAPETSQVLLQTANSLDALSGFLEGMVAVSVVFLTARLLPRWMNWLGWSQVSATRFRWRP